MPSYFENEIIFMKLIFCVTDGSLPSATKLPRLCFTGVCLSMGGYPSMHCRWYPSMHCSGSPGGCLLPGGCLVQGGSALGVFKDGLGGSAPGGSAPRGGLVSQHALRQTPPGRDGYCCGRYASHWNAFLFVKMFVI